VFMYNFFFTFSISTVVNHVLLFLTEFLNIHITINNISISVPLFLCVLFLSFHYLRKNNNEIKLPNNYQQV
jgi:hypothetical protein